MKRKSIKISLYVLSGALFVIGMFIFVYPLLSEYASEKNTEAIIENFENIRKSVRDDFQSENIVSSNEALAENNPEEIEPQQSVSYGELYKKMKEYNYKIFNDGQKGLRDAWSYEQTGVDLYEFGLYDGVAGILRVPNMNDLKMPIYLGASDSNMAKGAAQLGQTSMPVGGNNTNCVIAGHRGWNGARYFLDIEQLEIGDEVYIDNLWTTLSYEVSDIKIIQPDEIDEILIQENKDMVTLITCHPYWASTYRYAVLCTRTHSDVSEHQADDNQNVQTEQVADSDEAITDFESSQTRIFIEQSSFYAVPVALILLVALLRLKRVSRQR